MPPRFAYWTILAGGLPTSFRAADRDDLVPTFNRIKEKHPDAEMKYFARGQLWNSADEARRALRPVRDPQERGRRERSAEPRGRDWRPGGEHRDPRQGFNDAKKRRNQERRQQRWQHRQAGDSRAAQGQRPPRFKPHGDRFRDKLPRRDIRPTGTHRFQRNQGNQEMPTRPPRPDREPPPGREPKPGPPPRPSEPEIKPPGPPERGKRSRGPRPRKRQS